MEIHQLEYFVAVAEVGSFSRGADRCFVSQPSLSQQIKKLETELGYQLFSRVGRGAVLSDAGRALLPRARRILAEVRDVSGEGIGRELDEGKGWLNVGAIPTMAPYVLPPVISRFRKRYPECELRVTEDLTDNLVRALVDHEIDCAILATPIDDSLFEIEVLGAERLLLVAGAKYPIDVAKRVSLAVLKEHPVVVLHQMHCLGEQIQGLCTARRMQPSIVCEGTQLMTVHRMVELNLGISLVPEMSARADRRRRCQYHDLGRSGPKREIAAIWRRGVALPAVGRAFIDLVQADLESGAHSFSP